MAIRTIKLSAAGRLQPPRSSLDAFGGDVAFVGDRLVATAFDRERKRVLVFIYGAGADGTWRDLGELEVPLDCSPTEGAEWTTTRLTPWGPDRALVRVAYDAFGGEHGRTTVTFASELDLDRWTLSPAACEAGEPRCRSDGGDVAVFATSGAVAIQRGGGPAVLVPDPDADPTSRFGELGSVIGARSIWITATGTIDAPFEPRLHELDRNTLRVLRTVKLGPDARPGIGYTVALWSGGVLASSSTQGQAVYVSADGTPALFGDATWERPLLGRSRGQTSSAVGDGFAAIGAPFAANGAGRVTLFDRPGHPFAALTLANARRSDRLGAALAAAGPWLAMRFSRARTRGGIQLVRIDGTRVTPARV